MKRDSRYTRGMPSLEGDRLSANAGFDMKSEKEMLSVFPYIKASHNFYPLIDRLREAISASRCYGVMTKKMDHIRTMVKADLSQSFVPGLGWNLEKFYWSFQYWDRREPYEFHATTFFYRSKAKDTIDLYEFPADPSLKSIETFFRRRTQSGDAPVTSQRCEVLQYIPSLRLAVLVTDLDSDNKVVCKFKKRSRYRLAYEKLEHVFAAGCRSPVSFSLAAPIKIDHENRMFLQEAKSGQDLSVSMNAANFKIHTRVLGALHYELHQLDVTESGEFDFESYLDALKKNVSWIVSFYPAQGEMFREVKETLLKEKPTLDPKQYTYCHGDFICFNILIGEDGWSVIDFDLAMRGDPYLEMGRLIASLKYDVPFLNKEICRSNNMKAPCLEQAIDAYIDGYEERSVSALCRKRLLWYQMWYEIFYVALMLKKDRFDPRCYHYACSLLDELRRKFIKIRMVSF